MWDKGDVVLDADHFVGAEFSCNDGQEISFRHSLGRSSRRAMAMMKR